MVKNRRTNKFLYKNIFHLGFQMEINFTLLLFYLNKNALLKSLSYCEFVFVQLQVSYFLRPQYKCLLSLTPYISQ